MKIIVLLLLTFSSFGSELLVYGLTNSQAITALSAKPVFTKKEKAFLKKSSVNTNVFKVKADDIVQLKDKINLLCPKCITEVNSSGNLKSLKDPYYKYQWGLNNLGNSRLQWTSDIDAFTVFGKLGEDINIDSNEKDDSILVAIIDSGIDTNHPDLKDQLYTNKLECEALEKYNQCLNKESDKNICYEKFKNFDANGNGYALDCHGWSLSDKSNPLNEIEGNGNINDRNGHGTHIAGIIGAKKNKIGISGIIQNVKLLPIQVAVSSQNNSNELATDKFAKALLYAIQTKAKIVNMSLGWRFSQDSLLMRQMIELALSKKMLIVAAAGNDSHSAPTYPCSYEGVICVASHDINGKISSFSNFGSHIDILAPGSNILSTWPTTKRSRSFTIDSDYEVLSGTSQATPFVTGVLARLLNQGFNAEQARIKLLKGARNKLFSKSNLIKNGNLDYKKSVEAQTNEFIYPLNKSPLLINWDKKEKSFKVKLKNFSSKNKVVRINLEPLLKDTQKSFRLITPAQQKVILKGNTSSEIKFIFTADTNIEGNFLFKLKLNEKIYSIQAKALSLISAKTNRDDASIFSLEDGDNFTDGAILKEFKDYSNDTKKEFLAIKEINGETHIAKLTNTGSSYTLSTPLRLPYKNSVIINLSKVDLELDGKNDYVITLVNLADRDNRETKFLALDENFKPKRYFIAPKNTFKNDITVLPGGFTWLKYQQKMVPAWITIGKRPVIQREEASPWSNTPIEVRKNHLYLQLDTGIKSIDFKDKEELPLHFLYQNQLKAKGQAIFITSIGFGFDRRYKLYKFDNGIVPLGNIKLNKQFDLASSKPLPLVTPLGEHAFFNTPSVLGAQNILSLDFDSINEKLYIKELKAEAPKRSTIKFVLSVQGDSILSQSNTKLISQTRELNTTESKIDARRITHSLLRSKQALFLSAALAPGLGSEVIQMKNSKEGFYRPAHFQMLATDGCNEVGFIYEDKQDKILFSCPEAKKIIKIKL